MACGSSLLDSNASLGLCIPNWQIVLEGMGRSLHTNFNTEFTSDCLKVYYVAGLTCCCRAHEFYINVQLCVLHSA